ncbi:hypothetical protein GEMRC1_003602 [Eukaryota sp. GEM-RC1]
MKDEGSSGIVSNGLSLANTIIGAGTVAVPAAVAAWGYGGAFVGVIIVVLLSIYTIDTLVGAAVEKQKYTFQSLAVAVHSQKLGAIVAGAVALFGFAVTISYSVLVADSLPPVLSKISGVAVGEVWFTNRYMLSIIVSIVVFAPLCVMPTLSGLRYASASTILSVLYLAGLIFVAYLKKTFGTPPIRIS